MGKVKVKNNTELYLIGDMNINFGDKKYQVVRDLELTLKAHGLRQLIKEHTRLSATSRSIIDLIFTNSEFVANSGCIDINISDHLATFVTRKKHGTKAKKIRFQGRSYRTYVKENFQGDLIREDWTDFNDSVDPNTCWEIMIGNILRVLETQCPSRMLTVKEVNNPWITREALELINDKDRALSKAKRTNREQDWREARLMRNQVGVAIQNMRREFIEAEQQRNFDSPQKFLRNLKSVVPGKKTATGAIDLKDNGVEVPSEEVADKLNTFFTNIGQDLTLEYPLVHRWSKQSRVYRVLSN